MAKNNKVETLKVQATVDVVTDRVLNDIVALKFQGTTKSEVVCSILRMWLWENQDKLRQNGVEISPVDKNSG